ncbi:ATP-binding cassette domain-containing protein [Mariniluteicoccus endophyticus]
MPYAAPAPLGVAAQGWGWRHAGRSRWAVADLDLVVEPGERVLLLGASGGGKSTLLQALAGVLGGAEEGDEAGRLLVGGKHPTRRRGQVGLVLQDPQSQVVLARVGDDVAFGLENLGVPRDEIWPRVRAALDEVGLPVDLDRSTSALSSGQLQRLAIAGAVAMDTALLLLDEPTANLDDAGVAEVHDAVARVVADRRTTLVVVEHRVEGWLDLVDRVVVLAPGGGLLADGPPERVFADHRDALLAAGVWVPGAPVPLDPLPAPTADPEVLLTGHDLTVGHHGVPARTDAHVAVAAGCSTVVTGPNGCGKTTLALTLAGLLPPVAGRVEAAVRLRPPGRRIGWFRRTPDRAVDPARWASRDLLTRIGTVFAEPEHQLVATTVREELAVGLRALGRTDVTARVDELLAMLHLEGLAGAHPFTLSGGEKRRLSVGTVLATAPELVFLDEPTFGQDRSTWLDLVRLVQSLVADGRTIVSVTHDERYRALLGQRRLALEVQG